MLDDYAFLEDGLLALHEATGDVRWLESARGLADVMLSRFEDGSGGGFFLMSAATTLLVRPKPFEDGAEPSGNGVALRLFRKLADKPGSQRYARASADIESAAGMLLARVPHALPTTVAALLAAPLPRPVIAAKSLAASDAAGESAANEPFRLPRSDDHVRARLARVGDPLGLLVRLEIDEGWHVNANPASYPYLVATAVEGVDGSAVVSARYPNGMSFRPAFAEEPIQVYEGVVVIPVTLADSVAPAPRLAVRFQACDEKQCLPPHRAVIGLESGQEAER